MKRIAVLVKFYSSIIILTIFIAKADVVYAVDDIPGISPGIPNAPNRNIIAQLFN